MCGNEVVVLSIFLKEMNYTKLCQELAFILNQIHWSVEDDHFSGISTSKIHAFRYRSLSLTHDNFKCKGSVYFLDEVTE